jgi:hypothetical protein
MGLKKRPRKRQKPLFHRKDLNWSGRRESNPRMQLGKPQYGWHVILDRRQATHAGLAIVVGGLPKDSSRY